MCFWATPLDYRCRRTPYISLKKRPLAKLCTKNHKTPLQNDRKPPVRGKGELSGPNQRRIWGERGPISPRQGRNAGQNSGYSRRRAYPSTTAWAAAINHQPQTADHTEIKMTSLTPLLGRTAKKKRPGLAGVTPQNIAKTQPGRIAPPSQSLKIISQGLP